MNKNLLTRVSIGVTTALAAGLVALPAAADTVTIDTNGADTHNLVNITNSSTNTVSQSNDATVNNDVAVNNNTGGNRANENTGGDVTITSGEATGSATVITTANTNAATLGCGCETPPPSDVTISNNGADSHNKVKIKNPTTNTLGQANVATVNNKVRVRNKTGKNKANENTGGTVSVVSGNAGGTTTVNTDVNHNMVTP